MKNNKANHKWETLGVEAEKQIANQNFDLAKELLLKSIALKPDKPWPYLLLSSITKDNNDAIEIIKYTKSIKITEWYYINLIERYTDQIEKYKNNIDELKKEFVNNYRVENLKDESAIIHWNKIKGLKELINNNNLSISFEDIAPIFNKWDCLVLLCTGQEHIDDVYLKFLENLNKTIDLKISKNLDFKLIIKVKDKNKYEIPQYLINKFASVEIIAIDILEEVDIYDDKTKKIWNKEVLENYGSKYGPNFVFFETMKILREYNSSLLLECDCLLFDDWMNRINNYINSQSFLISGSHSDSSNNELYYHLRNQHINGGTAIYATGNVLFQKLMKLCEYLWPIYIKCHSFDLPYDYIILLTIQNCFDESLIKSDKFVWSYIKKNYIYNSLVFNWSDTTHNDQDPVEIQYKCNPAILHQKPNKYPGLFY